MIVPEAGAASPTFLAFEAAAERLNVSANAEPGKLVMYGGNVNSWNDRLVFVSVGERRFEVHVPAVLARELRTVFGPDKKARRLMLAAVFQYCYEATMPYEQFMTTPFARVENYASFQKRLCSESARALTIALKMGLRKAYADLFGAMHADLLAAWQMTPEATHGVARSPGVEKPIGGDFPFFLNLRGPNGEQIDWVAGSEQNYQTVLHTMSEKIERYFKVRRHEISDRFSL